MEICRIPRPENRGGGRRDRDRSRERYGRDRDRQRSRSPRDRGWRGSPSRDRGRDRDKFRDDPYHHNGSGRGGDYDPYGPHAVPEAQYGMSPRGMGGFGGPRGVPPESGMGRSAGPPSLMGPQSGSRQPRGLLEPPYPLIPSTSGPPVGGGGAGGQFSGSGGPPPPSGPPGRGPPTRDGYGPPENYGRGDPGGMRESYGGPQPPRAGDPPYSGGAGIIVIIAIIITCSSRQ